MSQLCNHQSLIKLGNIQQEMTESVAFSSHKTGMQLSI